MAAVERLLRHDRGPGADPPFATADQLACARVRLSESVRYADVVADRAADVETANRLAAALIESWLTATPAAAGPAPA